jgi:ADP-ribose pyrophosphatase YjhB (NUDIX family)
MEMAETVPDAAVRETREELGVKVEIREFQGLYSHESWPIVLAVYRGSVLDIPAGGQETLEFRLFTPDDIPWDQLAFPSTVAAMRDWMAHRGGV